MSTRPFAEQYDEAAIRRAMATTWIGRPLLFFREIASTNQLLGDAGDDIPAGAVAVADYQTAGRGRHGRSWEAPPGTSVLASVLLRPGWPAERAGWLIMAAGLAALQVVGHLGLPAALKWPNDIVIGPSGRRKLGGILIDSQIVDGRLQRAVLGAGLNVNLRQDQLPTGPADATSLQIELGRPLPRAPLLARYLAHLEAEIDRLATGHSPLQRWREALVTLGRPVVVTAAGKAEPLAGATEDVDEWGRLLVRDGAGRRHAVAAGDVTLAVDNSTR